jgi:hypothetical protein
VADVAQPWHIGSRVSRVRSSHSYGVVLALIVATFAFAAVAPDAAWSSSALVLLGCATLVIALWTSGLARAGSHVSALVLATGGAVAVVNLVQPGSAPGLLSGVMLAATAAAISVGVIDQGEVNARSVLGAICVYILVGLIFMFVFGAVAELGSTPLFAQGTDGTRALRVYFSYVTLATLGYGDYTPNGNLAQLLAVVEALIGQLYLVTVVALLVSRLHGKQ